jgi:hypothetical protein
MMFVGHNKTLGRKETVEIYKYLESKINLPPMIQDMTQDITIRFTACGTIEINADFLATKKNDEVQPDKIQELTAQLDELQQKLNMANKTVCEQIDKIQELTAERDKYNSIAASIQRSRSTCLNEIERLEIIVDYLENRGRE